MRELISILENQIQTSDLSDTEVGKQIERNYRYFTLQPLGNEQRGRSHYVSPDVLDSVESKVALFEETFLSNRQSVRFTSDSSAPPFEADAKTQYVNQVLKRNDKAELFADFWQDAFLAKRGVVLTEWREDDYTVTMPVTGANQQQIQMMASQQGQVIGLNTEGLQAYQTVTPQGMPVAVYSGEVGLIVDDSHVEITLCAPERYYRDPDVAYVKDGMWATFEDEVPRGTLISDGYSRDQVLGLKADTETGKGELIEQARKAHDRSDNYEENRDEWQENVRIRRTWAWLNMAAIYEGENYPDELRLWEIHWSGSDVLEWADGSKAIREADEIPFIEWCELKIAHAEYGMCDADVVSHTQKTQSSLKRGVLDNLNITNNPRYEALQDAIINQRDLTDNLIGGTVWTKQLGSVKGLDQPQLSPLTMGMMQTLQLDNERRSGMSSLAKGMNMDAISNQNADSMIERLTNAGKTRPMSAARNWAQTFLIPLAQMIVRIAMKYDKTVTQMESAGRMIEIAPSKWQDDQLDMDVAVALTPDEGANHAQRLMMMYSTMSQDEAMQPLFGMQEKHAMLDDVFDALGVSDTSRYMKRPESPEVQQSLQQRAMQAQKAMEEAQADKDFQKGLVSSNLEREWQKLNNEIMDTLADNEREDDELFWKKYVDLQEIDIERTQKRNASIN